MGHCRRTALHCALHKMLLRARLVLVRSVSSVKRGITPTGKQRWSSPGSHNSRHPTQRQLQNQKLKGETATRSSGSDNQTPKVAAVTCPSSEQHHQLHQNPQATKGAAPPAKRSAPSSIQDISDMRLVFLGTCSSEPTRTRNVTSLALRMGGKTWLFDCGEGTQRQICSTGAFTTPTIDRIFVTHMHGDHVYGLPGLLCNIVHNRDHGTQHPPIAICGPPGLRSFIHEALRLTTATVPDYIVRELHSTPATVTHADDLLPEAVKKDMVGHWQVHSDRVCEVWAGRIIHQVDCWGYVVMENPIKTFVPSRIEPSSAVNSAVTGSKQVHHHILTAFVSTMRKGIVPWIGIVSISGL